MAQNAFSRREFLHRSGFVASLAMVQASLPRWMPRLAFAPRYQSARGDVLVCVFLRGGADALNMIVPYAEAAYYAQRPDLALARPDDASAAADQRVLDLDGFFGLHPGMAPLLPLFQSGTALAVHASGSPDPTRSHFEAMDYMERGTPGMQALASGWIGRHLATLSNGNNSPVRAVGWGTAVPQSLRGFISPLALQSIADYHLAGRPEVAAQMLNTLRGLYDLETDGLQAAAQATQDALQVVQSVDIGGYVPRNGATYPEDDFAFGLLQTAALIRAEVGLEVACLDLGGWDTHEAQGAAAGRQANLVGQLASGLAAFCQDMQADMGRISLVVMSEFGRRVDQNASRGTDHGRGGALLLLGQHFQRSGVYTQWPGLEDLDGGALRVTTDYRDVLAELLQIRLGNPALDQIFPTHTVALPGLFRV
ncbi:MAG: DUF1501 domain-containing protein [Anaerolineae bacterium]|nr:DUF1501 domain-containing protein [Anaerolineae bacterium]